MSDVNNHSHDSANINTLRAMIARSAIRDYLEKNKSFFSEIEAKASFLNDRFRKGYSYEDNDGNSFESPFIFSFDDAFELAGELGYKVRPTQIEEMRGRTNKNKKEIEINKYLYEKDIRRAKFTLAHEIGHIVLDHKADDWNREDFDKPKILEKHIKSQMEASYFAGALLIPRRLGREVLELVNYDIERFSLLFDVTYRTAARRVVIISPIDMHYIAVNSDRILVEAYSNTSSDLPLQGSPTCRKWATNKSLLKAEKDEDSFHKQYSYVLIGANEKERLFVFARTINIEFPNREKFNLAISIGCSSKDSKQIPFSIDAEPTEVYIECKPTCPHWKNCEDKPI